MDLWNSLLDVIILLAAALVLGAIFERFRQSAILGYLLAGTLLGPNALHWISNEESVKTLAELGVALLLFTIGLEFSWGRLRRMGRTALGGGIAQVIITMLVACGAAYGLGLDIKPALTIGAVIALSSTASVLRILMARSEIESVHGRFALGILLVQDMAVVPLVIMVSLMSGGGGSGSASGNILLMILLGAVLLSGFYLLFNYIVPAVLGTHMMQKNRDLPILLAIVVGLGSAWTAHNLGFSPALGAFIAGMLLGESPFATQIRSDISSLRTVLLTLFFSSIGMLGNPAWMLNNWFSIVALVFAIIVGKATIVWLVLRFFKKTHTNAIRSGLCLAQVGEFSFVLLAAATIATADGASTSIITAEVFNLIVSATLLSLFLTPYLIAGATPISTTIVKFLEKTGLAKRSLPEPPHPTLILQEHIIVVGFGPAGKEICETLNEQRSSVTIIDLNSNAIHSARSRGFNAHIGDARQAEVLQHAHITTAATIVITLPDPTAVRSIVELARGLAPGVHIIARARYHIYRWELQIAGADVVVDEEQQVGLQLAKELGEHMQIATQQDNINNQHDS
ncbi:MAG: cation:proton antiporter [Planctomycetes bacterium]|nr:cation:proton antiporter [Planctomycetota bacterium]